MRRDLEKVKEGGEAREKPRVPTHSLNHPPHRSLPRQSPKVLGTQAKKKRGRKSNGKKK